MRDTWEERPDELEGADLVAWALTKVADAINRHWFELGTRDAATPMGALEHVAKEIKDGCERIADLAILVKGE